MLPSDFAADGDCLQHFEQEARAAAALNHPNIFAVHDIGAGSVRTISGLPIIGGALNYLAWGSDAIVLGFPGTGLFSVPATGGTPSPLTTLDEATGETRA